MQRDFLRFLNLVQERFTNYPSESIAVVIMVKHTELQV
jgi:hypothetical protein